MWIIGDIHGCHAELDQLLDQLPGDEKLLFIGDYVDRGPDSALVIERLLRDKERSVFLLGTHEAMLLAYYQAPDSREALAWTYPVNGGPTTLASYRLGPTDPFEAYPPAHRRFFTEELRLHYENEQVIAVHAGVRVTGSTQLSRQEREDLLWIREDWLRNEYRWNGKHIFYGHTPSRYVLGLAEQHQPIMGQKSIGIDTGCVYGGSLTAIHSQTRELVQVRAARSYV